MEHSQVYIVSFVLAPEIQTQVSSRLLNVFPGSLTGTLNSACQNAHHQDHANFPSPNFSIFLCISLKQWYRLPSINSFGNQNLAIFDSSPFLHSFVPHPLKIFNGFPNLVISTSKSFPDASPFLFHSQFDHCHLCFIVS